MSRDTYSDDDRDDPQEIDQAWADAEDADDDSDDTIECPECGKSLHWSAPRCPACGHWLEGESLAAQRSRGWVWPVVVVILIAVILVVWHGLRW